ncbi:hypothetical protein SEA_NICEHOUSE_43 [Rhodococcus phage NiceHouse]|nr:hypothetical protein SEA_NICEHOUSE_43 [Rhodococcus phage NiceHouse]
MNLFFSILFFIAAMIIEVYTYTSIQLILELRNRRVLSEKYYENLFKELDKQIHHPYEKDLN